MLRIIAILLAFHGHLLFGHAPVNQPQPCYRLGICQLAHPDAAR